MIASIEQAIRQRLSDSLGQVVTGIFIYGGEFDGEGLVRVVNRSPAMRIMFADIRDAVRHDTRGSCFKAISQFTVLAGDRTSGNEADSRFGDLHRRDVGTYRPMRTVRHLLTNRSLGLQISRLQPGMARSLFSRRMGQNAISVLALESETYRFEGALQDGNWLRLAVSDDQQTKVYADVSEYQGHTRPKHPDFKGVSLELRIPPRNLGQPTDVAATVETKVKP